MHSFMHSRQNNAVDAQGRCEAAGQHLVGSVIQAGGSSLLAPERLLCPRRLLRELQVAPPAARLPTPGSQPASRLQPQGSLGDLREPHAQLRQQEQEGGCQKHMTLRPVHLCRFLLSRTAWSVGTGGAGVDGCCQ
jgi:hypothetical protein